MYLDPRAPPAQGAAHEGATAVRAAVFGFVFCELVVGGFFMEVNMGVLLHLALGTVPDYGGARTLPVSADLYRSGRTRICAFFFYFDWFCPNKAIFRSD